jgi:maleate isomerase
VLRIGVLTPHIAPGPEEEFAAMAPAQLTTQVVRISADPPTTPSPLRALAGSALDKAAQTFAVEPVDVVGYASTSTAYALGFDAEAALVSRLSELIGVPVASTCASAVRALQVLDVERVALVEPPWFTAELNELGVAYFQSRGFDVVSLGSAELSQDPRRIEPADVVEWTSRRVPDEAQGVFIGGNGFRAAGAIDALERAIGQPVLTSNQVLLWSLLACADATFEVVGYGRLFAQAPPCLGSLT